MDTRFMSVLPGLGTSTTQYVVVAANGAHAVNHGETTWSTSYVPGHALYAVFGDTSRECAFYRTGARIERCVEVHRVEPRLGDVPQVHLSIAQGLGDDRR